MGCFGGYYLKMKMKTNVHVLARVHNCTIISHPHMLYRSYVSQLRYRAHVCACILPGDVTPFKQMSVVSWVSSLGVMTNEA